MDQLDWLGDPIRSVGAVFGHYNSNLVWYTASDSAADRAFQSIRRDVHFALRELSSIATWI